MKSLGKVLSLSLLALLACATAFAGGAKEEPKEPEVSAVVAPTKYKEAPMLAEMFKSGQLPSVDERLPEEPLVVRPVEEIGKYGGMLRIVSNEAAKLGDGRNTVGRAMAVKYDYDAATLIPNFVKKWEFSEGGKVLTMYYRKGVKWSDGHPFTTEDVRFWYEDALLNEELNPSIYPAWKVGGKVMKLEIVDDYTVRYIFAAPNPLILDYLCTFTENHWEDGWVYPSHYMKQFHPRYRPKEELDKLVKEKGFNNWWELFKYMSPRLSSLWSADQIGIPTLRSHEVTEVGPNYIVMTRNPYFWKVDTAGNQLPYIDRIYAQIVEKELYHGKVASGEADMAMRRASLENLALYKNGEASGNYKVYLWKSVSTGEFIILLNFNHEDPVLRSLINDVRFRIALSHAINREEFNNVINLGLAYARQMTLPPWSRFMEPDFETAYASYDAEKANALLDEIGLKWDNKHEYRLRPDGRRLTLLIEEAYEHNVSPIELVTEYWEKIGIDLQMKMVDRTLKEVHLEKSKFDLHMTQYGMMDAAFINRPDMYLPVEAFGTDVWAPLWAQWWQSDGVKGEEPPAEVKKNIETWRKMLVTTDQNEVTRLAKSLLRSQAENLWTIGITTCGPRPVIARNTLGNFLKDGVYSYDQFVYALYAVPDQWFFKE